MAIWRKTFQDRYPFRLAPIKDLRLDLENQRIRSLTYRGLIATICTLIILFQAFKRWDREVKEVYNLSDSELVLIEDIPVTRQEIQRPVPPRPVVPIPSDDPTIPEDLTIEETELDFEPLAPIQVAEGNQVIIPPRPIAEVIPEYPEIKAEKGTRAVIELALFVDEAGMVTNVQMISNSTPIKAFEQSAIEAAYQTRFIPAKKRNQPVSVWFNKKYTFDIN